MAAPLQVMFLAMYDSVLLYIVNEIGGFWQMLRETICYNLVKTKNRRLTAIMGTVYKEYDIIFVQEAAKTFEINSNDVDLYNNFKLYHSDDLGDVNQVSMILISKKFNCTKDGTD